MRTLFLLLLGLVLVQPGFSQEPKQIYFHNPSWSPDGKQIVFESNRDGKFAVYTIGVDGSRLQKLTDGKANDEQPRWSRDGRKIVFISDREGAFNVFLMRADGSSQVRISSETVGTYIPELSPKGDKVIFVSGEVAFLVSIGGKSKNRLPDGGEHLRWSPDGKQILFSKAERIPDDVAKRMPQMTREERRAVLSKRDSSAEIFVMKLDGTPARKITSNDARDEEPEWTLDGKRIYFLSHRTGSPKVFVMNVNGKGPTEVADGTIVTGTAISADEKYFVYAKQVDGRHGIYVYDISNKTERVLITSP